MMSLFGVISSLVLVSTTPKEQPVPGEMYQFLYHATELQPYVSSKESFRAPENREKILKHLKTLEQVSRNLPQHQRLEDPIFVMTAQRLIVHLRSAVDSFEKGRPDYARRTFQEALDGCSSCHAQVRGKSEMSWAFEEEKIKGSDFEKAEFWYVVRQYDTALKLYENLVQNYKPEQMPLYELNIALNRIASILVRSYLDLDRAQVTFLKLSTNKNLPQQTRQKLRRWANDASRLSDSGLQRKNIKTAAQLQEISEQFFKQKSEGQKAVDDALVRALFLSGLLYDFAHQRETVTPEILYNLAKCEKVLGDDFLLSMSNLYLRRCIVQFPESPVAQKCFEELKSSTELSFTGSSGVHLPKEVQADLEDLKSRLSKNKPVGSESPN